MALRLNGSTSGFTELTAPAVAGSNTLVLPTSNGSADQALVTNGSGTLSFADRGRMTLGTAVASTSGTSIDFTSIPSYVKRITVMFNGVSTNGSSGWLLQIGDGSISTTSYTSNAAFTGQSTGGSSATAGYVIVPAAAGINTNSYTGLVTLSSISSNTWVQANTASLTQGANLFGIIGGGTKTLSGTLDRIRITTVNGTDTFDAGTINIMYEG